MGTDAGAAAPLHIAGLAGRRVALWGWGREGRAAHAAVRERLPDLPLTLFCSREEAAAAATLDDPRLAFEHAASAARLAAFEVVVKSPGISPYGEAAEAANGTIFTGGTALWFAERPDADTLCVTGTKGKSTTTALLAHLLRAAGRRTALAGNIGVPLLELVDAQADLWAVELSSYQTRDVAASGTRPHVAIATNVYPEHLDWHGGQTRYVADKLALLVEGRPRIAVLNAADPVLSALSLPDSEVLWYGREDGWHLRGDELYRAGERVLDTHRVPLAGRHNRGNLSAVLAAAEAIGLDARALARHAESFAPLPNRLQVLGERDGLRWVNDSISTTPHATLAALEVFGGRPVALLVGGHDRGLDWSGFAAAMRTQAPAAIVTMGHGVAGQNGARLHEMLRPLAAAGGFTLSADGDLGEAVAQARAALAGRGVVLLSPGAPSFGVYRDYVARGRDFARLAGFDPEAIGAIPGLGIA